jgi:hypothetical protein
MSLTGLPGNVDISAEESFPALPGNVADLTEGVVTMSVPGNYDDSGITVRVVGWVGTSASDAQDFSTQWTRAVNNLFGSTSDPTSGALPKVTDAVAQAAMNYGVAEDTITASLKGYAAGSTLRRADLCPQ